MQSTHKQRITDRRKAALDAIARHANYRVEVTNSEAASADPDALAMWVWVANANGRFRSQPDLELITSGGDHTASSLLTQLAVMVASYETDSGYDDDGTDVAELV